VKAVSFVLAAGLLVSASVHADTKRLLIPVDSKARYIIVDRGWQGAERIIVTKRVARGEIRFSKRLYNCENNTVKSLGEADSLEALASATAERSMGAIAPESVSYYISLEACRYLRNS
jgi:hypothetical protein